ncbi:PREDICTED: uncharacterized protein LOC105558198 [Vollenhovia emeryi]|uniref:uncharacterized protein LOC105558198 n=1 Tax=Vollenhovia emeryi TaxID=411798 RepID=UPI0005F55DF3|nr:PREDICTED: uncharacterized protein LOC105558198 [Vollenhovia emeryi]
MSGALSRLMPNLRGPSEHKRRLFYTVVLSVVIYASPVWSPTYSRNRRLHPILRGVQRTIALRMAAAYRTTSLDAATLLVRVPPVEFLLTARERLYEKGSAARAAGAWTREAAEEARAEISEQTRAEWREHLGKLNVAGARTREAILPVFEEWMNRGYGKVTFRITQLLTGHGCFGTYLRRIGKAVCPYCWEEGGEGEIDSAEHTIADCRTWSAERAELTTVIGEDLSLRGVVQQMVETREKWAAFSLFVERVMRSKEEAERRRQEQEREAQMAAGGRVLDGRGAGGARGSEEWTRTTTWTAQRIEAP